VRIFLLAWTLAAALGLHAQNGDEEREKLRVLREQQEQARQLSTRMELDSAKKLTDLGRYEEADELYRHVLTAVRSVPSDLAFYFGKNSYYLGQHRQAIDWLSKYIQLRGATGQFFDEANQIKKRAETAVLQTRKEDPKKSGALLSKNYDIDCGPSGMVTCPVCKGQTVVIRANHLGATYRACGYCNQTGTLSCADYNKLVRGELKPKP
jgi:tetratricopeptide (TPR) repeat protein